jgi:hypothetical protein
MALTSTSSPLSTACRAILAPVTAFSLGALAAPAEILLLSPADCIKLAETDPVLALGTITSEITDRSNHQAYERAFSEIQALADAAMDQHLCELAAALHDDADGSLMELLGQGLSKWVEMRERERAVDAGAEPWTLGEYDPFLVLLEKHPGLRIYPLLEERIRDLLNRFPPRQQP